MKSYMGAGSYPRRGIHVVEIQLQSGEYKATIYSKVAGNCMGATILQSAISDIEGGDYEPQDEHSAKHVLLDDDGFVAAFILYNENGDELICDDPNDFANLVVGARIIDWVEENRQGESVNANVGK